VRSRDARRALFLVAAALVLLAADLWLMRDSALARELFGLRRVVIRGNVLTPSKEIFSALGAAAGDGAYRFDADIARAKLADLRWVKRADFSRKMGGTLVVDVSERRPVLFAVAGGNRFWLMADDDDPLPMLPGIDSSPVLSGVLALPHVRFADADLIGDRSVVWSVEDLVSRLVAVLPDDVKGVGVSATKQVYLTVKGGQVLFGGFEDVERKVAALPKSLRVAHRRPYPFIMNVSDVENIRLSYSIPAAKPGARGRVAGAVN
jgi:hypothetical protein